MIRIERKKESGKPSWKITRFKLKLVWRCSLMLAAACPPDANKSKKARHPLRTTHNISCGMHRECTSHASHFCVVPLPMLCGEELPSLVQGVLLIWREYRSQAGDRLRYGLLQINIRKRIKARGTLDTIPAHCYVLEIVCWLVQKGYSAAGPKRKNEN